MKLLYDLFGQLFEVRVFSRLINNRVIFQKMVFGFFSGYSLFLAIFFRVIDAWSSEFLTIGPLYLWSVLFGIVQRFIQQEVQKTSIFWLLCSQLGKPYYSNSYLNWYNFHPRPLVFNLPLIEIARTQFFVRWMDCNTPLPEYVLSCVFRFFNRIFRFTFCIYFVLWIIYMIVLSWIRIHGLRVCPSLNRGPDPNVLLDLVFPVLDLTDFSFKHHFLIF